MNYHDTIAITWPGAQARKATFLVLILCVRTALGTYGQGDYVPGAVFVEKKARTFGIEEVLSLEP